VTTNGTGYTVLHTFTTNQGCGSRSQLLLEGGTLFGTATGGYGTSGNVFSIKGNGTAFTNLYTFNSSIGVNPMDRLMLSGSNVIGTTYSGPEPVYYEPGYGTVFELSTNGGNFTVLCDFGGYNGNGPAAGVVMAGDTLYGTTYYGGSTWTTDYTGIGAVFSLNLSPAAFVAVANGDTNAAFSFDGINWAASPGGMPVSDYWQSVAYGNGMFVAIASGSTNAAYSSNGINWTASPTGLPSSDGWISIAYGNGTFVTISGSGDNAAAYSTDGINWIASPGGLPALGGAGGAGWMSFTYGNGMFVAVPWNDLGANQSAYSTNGINWTVSTLRMDLWYNVVYGNGVFSVVAQGGDYNYSTNGIDWTTSGEMPCFATNYVYQIPLSDSWLAMAYGNGTFAALTQGDTNSAYSSDGMTWTPDTGGLPIADNWVAAAYGSGVFVAVASGDSNAMYSINGISWSASTLPVSDNWSGVAARQ
jgi:hypothetical protein